MLHAVPENLQIESKAKKKKTRERRERNKEGERGREREGGRERRTEMKHVRIANLREGHVSLGVLDLMVLPPLSPPCGPARLWSRYKGMHTSFSMMARTRPRKPTTEYHMQELFR